MNERTETIITKGLSSGVNVGTQIAAMLTDRYSDRLVKVEVTSGKVVFTVRDAEPETDMVSVARSDLEEVCKRLDFIESAYSYYRDRGWKDEAKTFLEKSSRHGAAAMSTLKPYLEHRVWDNVPDIEMESGGESDEQPTVVVRREKLTKMNKALKSAASAIISIQEQCRPEPWSEQLYLAARNVYQVSNDIVDVSEGADVDAELDEYTELGTDAETVTLPSAQLKRALRHAVNASGGATWEDLRTYNKDDLIQMFRYSEGEANNAANILRALLVESYFGGADTDDES